MTNPKTPRANIADAYRAMATEADYRPTAPSDGCGHITVPLADLNLDKEARAYASQFLREENNMRFWIGCTDFTTAKATIYAIEAARLLCGGVLGVATARRLLAMALAELQPATEHPACEVA